MNEFEKIILSSDIINFFLFTCIIAFLMGKYLPSLVNQRNDEIRSDLAKAAERFRLAQEQLDFAERELENFKRDFNKMKDESENRLKLLRQELSLESEAKMQALKERYDKEIVNLHLNLRNHYEKEIALKALSLVENRFASNPESPEVLDFGKNSLKEILAQIKPSNN
ncbi:MAG: hypothetical protein SFT81_03970 [Candidatus Caenarcaniphilales bacterium]|nr:hypothetical protein [Candidatus Caenarcaniphilales bacterium]